MSGARAGQQADQIAHRIYTKLFHVVYGGRATEQGGPTGKTDKWFNLETPVMAASHTPGAELDAYRVLSSSPFALQVFQAVPPPPAGTALVHAPTRTRIHPHPRFVLLEEWVLRFTDEDLDADVPAAATVYKSAISLFRAVYALLRVLPAWRVARRLGLGNTRPSGGKGAVVVRVRGGEEMTGTTTLRFGDPPSSGEAPLPTATHVFPGIRIGRGALTLSATYLPTPTFTLEALETLFSKGFAVLDAGGSNRDRDQEEGEFVPTLARRSITASSVRPGAGGSPGRRISAPLPQQQRPQHTHDRAMEDVLDRFVLPKGSASASPDRGVPFPMPMPVRMTSGMGSASGSPTSPSPIPIPIPIQINPFKSNTLSLSRSGLGSTSTSLLRGGGGGAGVAFPPQQGAAGVEGGAGPGPAAGIPVRKRYSSSFPHRYGSLGSGGSGESGSASGSFQRKPPGAGTDDPPPPPPPPNDEITSFVKDIDAARPLLGRLRQERHGPPSPGLTPGTPGLGPESSSMLTSEAAVDERLRVLNAEFLRSLEGLGRGSGSGSGSGSVSGSQEVIGRME